MKAFSLQESTEQRASACNESGGRGGGEAAGRDKADLLHSGTVSIFRQLRFLLRSRSCRNIPSADTETRCRTKAVAAAMDAKGGERDVVFGAGCQILVTFAASVSFPATDEGRFRCFHGSLCRNMQNDACNVCYPENALGVFGPSLNTPP